MKVAWGCVAWIATGAYFLIEWLVARATTAPYDALRQPMSDLAVTRCGERTYPMADYEICSPLYLWMNVTFVITGVVVIIGAVLLRGVWPPGRRTRLATWLLIAFGVSFTLSGLVPADVGFTAHVLVSLPGMIVHVPALFLLGRAHRGRWPALAALSYGCAVLSLVLLAALVTQPLTGLPGGLLQRLLYGVFFAWAVAAGVLVLVRSGVESAPAGSAVTRR